MQELINITFGSKTIPEGWTGLGGTYSFERGALRSGRSASPRFMLPGHGWHKLRVEVEVEPIGKALISCSDGTMSIVTDFEHGMHRITYYGPGTLAMGQHEIPRKDGAYLVAFDFDHGRLSARIDGVEVVAGNDPRPTPALGLFTLGFWHDCLIHRVRILGEEPLPQPVFPCPPRRRSEFHLEVNVDFVDDLICSPWTTAMFDELFAEYARWGVKRCHWIYYGRREDGWWDNAGYAARNAAITLDNVGEIFPAAVRAAHAHGVEIYGMLKPFDMGLPESHGESTPEAAREGKLPRIGGPKRWVANFPAQHRELIMARKPHAWGPAINQVVTRIDLVKNDAAAAAFATGDLRLFVSDDNASYRPYDGPMTRQEVVEDYPVWEQSSSGGRTTGETRRVRVMRFKDLDIRNKYVALAVDGRAGSFSNTLINLLHVFGEKGEERRLTYGLVARQPAVAQSEDHPSFQTAGIEYDTALGSPSAVFPCYEPIAARHTFDAGHGFLAFASGKEAGPIALLSPSFPETRAWWLSWLGECLDAGADGIELRVRNHNYNLTWSEFGFEPPVLEEFKRRYGVDLLATDDFDRAAWRRLRGEGYTEFCRQAKQLAASYGKPMGIHVSPTLNMEPQVGAAMEIHWDWRTWLQEGLADSVTMKEIWPGTRLAEEVLSYTRPMGIPVVFCPYANNIWKTPGGDRTVMEWIRLAREHGYDGYQYYENAAIVHGTAEGHLHMTQPGLREVLQREFPGKHAR